MKLEESRLQDLATKGDILRLERDIKELETRIETVKADTIKRTAGMFAAQTALIIGAMFAVMKINQPHAPVYQATPIQEMRLPAPQGIPATPPAPVR
ncbi:MAG: hypothetical protein HQL95_09775 [Magnetococcales bacterium]|nr:hypothetical protein [Magnetococcales bacterium]